MALWGKTDAAGSKPKYLTTDDKAVTFGVSVSEAQQTVNRDKGIKTPGWTKTVSYTDHAGNKRTKSEVLVAFGGDFTGADAADDAVVLDVNLLITLQPEAATVTEGDTATFSVTATVDTEDTITYQWQKQEAGETTWSAISGATSDSYTTGALTVADDNGDKYRVVVAVADKASVTSDAVELTVEAA